MALSKTEVQQRLTARFPGEEGRELYRLFSALIDDVATTTAALATTDSTASTLATTVSTLTSGINTYTGTLVAKLNADAGVTDTDYAASAL